MQLISKQYHYSAIRKKTAPAFQVLLNQTARIISYPAAHKQLRNRLHP